MHSFLKYNFLIAGLFSLGVSNIVNAANDEFVRIAKTTSNGARAYAENRQYEARYAEIEAILESGVLEIAPPISTELQAQIITALTDPSGINAGFSIEQALRSLQEVQRNTNQQGFSLARSEGRGGGAVGSAQQGGGGAVIQTGVFTELGLKENLSLRGFTGEINTQIIREAIIRRLPEIPDGEGRERFFDDLRKEVITSACEEGIRKGWLDPNRLEECRQRFSNQSLLSFQSFESIGQRVESGLLSLVNLTDEDLDLEHRARIEKELEVRGRKQRKPTRIAASIRDAKGICDTEAERIRNLIANSPVDRDSQALVQRLNQPSAEGGPRNAQEFIYSLPDRAFNERFNLLSGGRRDRSLLRAHVVYQTLDRFWSLEPDPEQVAALIRKVGIEPAENIDLIMHIKRGAILRVVRNTGDYQQILGEVILGAFRNRAYREANNLLIVETIQSFAARDEMNRDNLRELHNFVAGEAFDEASRLGVVDDLLQDLGRIMTEMPENVREQLLQKFAQVIRDLFEQLQPQVTEDAEIAFYMIDEEKCKRALNSSVLKDGETECTTCFEIFGENQKGIGCQFHREDLALKPSFHIKTELKAYADIERQAGNFPIKCRSATNDAQKHELPLNRDVLIAAGFTLDKIYEIQMGTLASYYRALLRLERGQTPQGDPVRSLRVCPSPDCGTFLLARDRDDHGNIRCQLCDQRWCYSCEAQRPHPGLTCLQVQERGEVPPDYLDPDNRLRPCPYCGTPCDKDDACNSVTCHVCRQQFNVVDGAPRERTPTPAMHWFNHVDYRNWLRPRREPVPLPRRRYRVPGDRDYSSPEDLSAYPGDGLAPQDPSRRGYGRDPATSDQTSQGQIRNFDQIRWGEDRYQGN